MNGKEAEAPGVAYRVSPPANEVFTEIVKGPDRLSRHQPGWDPYEVWRTRVKGSFSGLPERERGALRWRVRLALRGRRLHATSAEGVS
jgi:hypothetical protein